MWNKKNVVEQTQCNFLWTMVERIPCRSREIKYIVNLWQIKIQKQGITFRKALSVEKRVAVAMWRLASGNSYRTINEVFGTGKSPVIKLVQEFLYEISWVSRQYVKFPRKLKTQQMQYSF